ncbi:MAG: PLD nuclease N-terminal domain-containing protein [Patescibacteria group bacterium]
MTSLFGGLIVGWGIIVVIMLAGLVFWIVMLVHAIRHDIKDKALWIIIMILTGWLGAIVYYFVVKRNFVPGAVPSAAVTYVQQRRSQGATDQQIQDELKASGWDAAAIAAAFAPPMAPGTGPKKSNAWIWVLAILVILLAIAGYSMFQSISAIQVLPTDTLEAYPSDYVPEDRSTETPTSTPIKTWHPVVTFTHASTGISGFGNTPQFTIQGKTFRMRWTATQGSTSSQMSISANGVPNSSYGCDFLNFSVTPGSGTLTCNKTGTFYLKLKPNQNIPWSIAVEDLY